jgi:hypothetical protein
VGMMHIYACTVIQKMCYEGLAGDVIQKMRYEGESQSWNWDKYCAKFHQEIRVIDEWAMAGMANAYVQQLSWKCRHRVVSPDPSK